MTTLPLRNSVNRVLLRRGVLLIALALASFALSPTARAQAQHVSWDIISLDFTTTPFTISRGGVAFALARDPNTLSIKLTRSGTFVAPASGRPSAAVTGGGTRETFNDAVSTGSGTDVGTR